MPFVPTTFNAGAAPGMSAAELNKLGSQYDAVKAELGDNAGELWEAIKGVDGNGSGLDADLLDGKHASDFLGVTAKAADSNLLDGHDTNYFTSTTTFNSHVNDKTNPHNVTAQQAGALPLQGGNVTGPIVVDVGSTVAAGFVSKVASGQEPAKFQIHNPDNTVPFTTLTQRDNQDLTIEKTSDQNAASLNATEVFRLDSSRAYAYGHAIYDTANKPTAADVGALPSNGTATNSDKLDGFHASSFLRSDTSDTMNGDLHLTGNFYIGNAFQSDHVVSFLNAGTAQGMNLGSLLVSNSYSDGPVPTNGIFSKGGITTQGDLYTTGKLIFAEGSGNYDYISYDDSDNSFTFISDQAYGSASYYGSRIKVGRLNLAGAYSFGTTAPSGGEAGDIYFQY